MKYYMNEGTIVSQSTTLDGYMVKRASLPHAIYQSWANGVMKYYMNEGTIVSQSTTLDGYMVKRASLPHSTFGMKELVDTFIIWV
jgi:hypothetical protein